MLLPLAVEALMEPFFGASSSLASAEKLFVSLFVLAVGCLNVMPNVSPVKSLSAAIRSRGWRRNTLTSL